MSNPPLKFLHPDESLSKAKLATIERLENGYIKMTLAPGRGDCLKVRPDGTVLDEHHRIYVLCSLGIDVDALPREIVARTDIDE